MSVHALRVTVNAGRDSHDLKPAESESPLLNAAFSSHRRSLAGLLAAVGLIASLVVTEPAGAANPTPAVPAGYTVSLFASAPSGASIPDDIARLDGHLFVGYANGVGPNGEANGSGGTSSTVVQYNDDGSVANQWSLIGKVDGLGADPANHRVIATVNEDSNSSLYTITPSLPPSGQVTNYLYSPNPSPSSGSEPLLTGGGTDAVTVLPNGTILIAASNPQSLGASPQTIVGGPITATFVVQLAGPVSPSLIGTATLSPSVLDDSQATLAPADTSSTALDLSDPDSTAYVPFSSPLFGGQFVQVSQGDHQLVFVSDIGSPSAHYNASDVTVLNLAEKVGATTTSAGVDDVRWADGDGGTLYVVDASGGAGGAGAIYAITGPFFPGEAFASVSETGAPNSSSVVSDGKTVDTLNLASGVLTPFASGFVKTAGEVWVPAGGGESTGPQGSPGPAGPAGPTGPRGKAGRTVVVICVVFWRGSSCSKGSIDGASALGASVEHATLSRGARRYASGRIVRRNGRDLLSLRAVSKLPRGRYTLTLERRRGSVTTTTKQTITLG